MQAPSLSPSQVRQRLTTEPEFIRKSKINYFDCSEKGMHEGEKLNLVCIDSKCTKKGLICPVCKEVYHKDHQVLHVKLFLGELQNKLMHPENQEKKQQENNTFKVKTLSEQLNLLQNAKKNILVSLQESVATLAKTVKDLQNKIQQEYIRIRKIILSQKSFESRLPKIYSTLISNNNETHTLEEQNEIKQQIKKLTQLLQKNKQQSKPKVVSSVENIIDMYVKNSDTCTTHLLSLMTELPKKFTDLPIKIKSISQQNKPNKNENSLNEYVFSSTLKAESVLVSEDKKQVSIMSDDSIGGLVFLDNQNKQDNSQIKRINLKITSSVSESISIGVGDVQKMQNLNYVIQQMQNQGLYGICSMGVDITNIQIPTFVFSQGDIIQIVYDIKQRKIQFSRRNGMQKQEIYVGATEEQAKKHKFFVNLLLYGDSVQIVE